jgi:tRNA threonylcarbamoyladenosine biosynthesis protein TsaB
MRVLAWDTSSKTGVIVALESLGGELKLVSEWVFNVEAAHSEQLLWGIHQVLQSLSWKLPEVDVLGVGVGPGSFTGLRMGVTTARTLGYALGKPLVGVSSLEVLAYPACHLIADTKKKPYLVVVRDACQGEVFALWGLPDSFQQDCLAVKKLGAILEKDIASTCFWVGLGEARARYPELWERLDASRELSFSFPHVMQGRALGALVWKSYQEGKVSPALEVYPSYFRVSNAELKKNCVRA